MIEAAEAAREATHDCDVLAAQVPQPQMDYN
jgi:hypothetical protein